MKKFEFFVFVSQCGMLEYRYAIARNERETEERNLELKPKVLPRIGGARRYYFK